MSNLSKRAREDAEEPSSKEVKKSKKEKKREKEDKEVEVKKEKKEKKKVKKEAKKEEKEKKEKREKKEKEKMDVEDGSVSSGGAGAKECASSKEEATESAPSAGAEDIKPVTILLFYAYCKPHMTAKQQDHAITKCYKKLTDLGVTGRLRVGREGFNSTLTGPHESMRHFTAFLRKFDHATFGETDFKYVDNQPQNQLLPVLKVFPVAEIVTYGFKSADAPMEKTGTHLSPTEFHKALAEPNSVVIDVRNYNETLIGKFAPPEDNKAYEGPKVMDPLMRKSTEFPAWVQKHKSDLEGKKVLMYCTAGVRCERASAFLRNSGVNDVYQLEGGIHRYLEEYEEDGGYWKGKNYVFDKRFSHGAKQAEVVSTCVYCDVPWDRYNSKQKCFKCRMEILLCNQCQRKKPALSKSELFCPLCKPKPKK